MTEHGATQILPESRSLEAAPAPPTIWTGDAAAITPR